MNANLIYSHFFINKRYPCACCGFLTLSKAPPGTFEVCPICFWEDDNVQFNNIDFERGANEESLRQAQANFKKFGASSLKFLKQIRPPLPEEFN